MKRNRASFSIRLAAGALAACAIAWAIAARGSGGGADPADAPPGKIKFACSNSVSTARGEFKSWRIAKSHIDREHPESSVVQIEIDVASLDTGIKKRDDDLRQGPFFDVKNFPKAMVAVREARPKSDAQGGKRIYAAKMDLEIKGVKKTMDAEFEVEGDSPMTARGKVQLNRLDFGVGPPRHSYNPLSPHTEVAVEFEAILK